MIISSTEYKNAEIISYIPMRLKNYLIPLINDKTEEIRLRTNRPLAIRQNSKVFFVTQSSRLSKNVINTVTVTKDDIEAAMGLLCNSSVYAYENEIKDGYITLPSGHRVGISGNAVITNDRVSFINNINALNYRIAHEIKGCSDKVIRDIFYNNRVRNTLIISPPGSGKTTLLRDLARTISNLGKNVSILDERGEIAAIQNGIPGFDIGSFSDVLNGCKKPEGIPILLRSMSPEVIITDELGGKSDIDAISDAKSRGVNIIATIHGSNVKEIPTHILESFSCIIVLSSRLGAGTVEEIMIK